MRNVFIVLALLVAVLVAMRTLDQPATESFDTAIFSQEEAVQEDFDWGTLFTYYKGESYGTRDALAAVAIINPGMEIHPPHQHAEEEYLIVTEGEGTWSLHGESRPAMKGDMLYASPWDWHGITNTGTEPMTFVVWKWNNKGVALPMAKD